MKEPFRVFVVDDDAAARDAMAMLMGALGWEVQPFATAAECLQALDRRHPDCIVSDLAMAGLNGADLQQELGRRGCGVPLVIVTGIPDETPLVASVRALRGCPVVRKPFGEDDLCLAIARAMAARWVRPPAALAS
jgi:two-component system, LuxR family, response regulator FixJ